MSVTNPASGTRIDEIASGIYRISTPVPPNPGLPHGFSFNQFLIVDDEPLLFHTGQKRLFPLVRQAVETVMPLAKLRWISFGHHEPDEDGSLEAWLEAAPSARVARGAIGTMVTLEDDPSRPARTLADGEILELGQKRVRWLDTPHLPHGWDAGMMFEVTGRTLFGGDLFTQAGADLPAVTEGDLVGPSEGMRAAMDYFSNLKSAAAQIEKIASTEPQLIACMHGSSFRGDGAAALRGLAAAIGK